MIKCFSVENFKCFKNESKIDLGKITIFVGSNSSGKTSLIHSLLAMKSSIQSNTKRSSLILKTEEKSLGRYDDVVYGHKVDEPIIFKFQLKTDGKIYQRYFPIRYKESTSDIPKILNKVKEVVLELKFEYDKVTEENRLTCFRIQDVDNGELINLHGHDSKNNSGKLLKFFEQEDKAKLSEIFEMNILSQKDVIFFPFYKIFREQNEKKFFESRIIGHFLDSIINELKVTLESIHYLGPLRKSSGRYYDPPSEVPQTVGFDGENAIQLLFKDEEDIKKKVNKWIKKLELANSLTIQKSSDTGGLLSVICEDKLSKLNVNLADLGFGTSQVLPFIVEGFSSPTGTLFISEQPEIHLHPKAQTYLADMLVNMVNDDKQAIIETHSEHLIIRLQTLIASGKMKSSDVKIYFFKPTKNGTQLIDSMLNDLGEMTQEWPIGFFSESYNRSLEFAQAKNKKR